MFVFASPEIVPPVMVALARIGEESDAEYSIGADIEALVIAGLVRVERLMTADEIV
jgi:hypothetical protein